MPRTNLDTRLKKGRSRVTNGSSLFVEAKANAQSPWARRFRDLIGIHTADLGGAAVLSEAQRSLIRRAATIETELERFEGRIAGGEDLDVDTYSRAASHLRRILETLGLKRELHDITPTLAEYLAKRDKGAAE